MKPFSKLPYSLTVLQYMFKYKLKKIFFICHLNPTPWSKYAILKIKCNLCLLFYFQTYSSEGLWKDNSDENANKYLHLKVLDSSKIWLGRQIGKTISLQIAITSPVSENGRG